MNEEAYRDGSGTDLWIGSDIRNFGWEAQMYGIWHTLGIGPSVGIRYTLSISPPVSIRCAWHWPTCWYQMHLVSAHLSVSDADAKCVLISTGGLMPSASDTNRWANAKCIWYQQVGQCQACIWCLQMGWCQVCIRYLQMGQCQVHLIPTGGPMPSMYLIPMGGPMCTCHQPICQHQMHTCHRPICQYQMHTCHWPTCWYQIHISCTTYHTPHTIKVNRKIYTYLLHMLWAQWLHQINTWHWPTCV